ncbi:unnamed protein product [Aphanomyces euteiches]|uniref:Mitogen-activated protein kinase n=2 Tax=Aphanomyces euteiches TaxID=100861 RepID=A0A6G0WXN6_9STRA|nr:hypothetical protein Ae201684_010583 [Aphanomyces euteiches]KAH9089878.1 hypothetical protein Ae201684P_014633 [Aphanomyces euteiches]KAH9145402.1 hypothetical protein AeRB84_010755 [Aphanomyces euteiches]
MLRPQRGEQPYFKRSMSQTHGEAATSSGLLRMQRASHHGAVDFADLMSRSGPVSQGTTRPTARSIRSSTVSESGMVSIRAGLAMSSVLPTISADSGGLHSVHWEGHVRKKGDWLPRWEPRYLVLDGTVLRYYLKQEDARVGKHLRGKLTITKVFPEFYKKKEHGFAIETIERKTFHLTCDTELEKDMWLEMIQAGINEAAAKPAGQAPRRLDHSAIGESVILQQPPSTKTSNHSYVASTYTPQEAPIDVREFYNAMRHLLISHAASAQFFPKLTRDIVLTSNYSPTVPFWGDYHGLDGILHFFSILYDSVEYTAFFATDIAQATEGATAIVTGRETIVNKANNRKFTQQWTHTLEFSSDGRVKSIHIAADSTAMSAVFGCTAMARLRLPSTNNPPADEPKPLPRGLVQIHVLRGEHLGTPTLDDDDDEDRMTVSHVVRRSSNMDQYTGYVVAFSIDKPFLPPPSTPAAAAAKTDPVQSEVPDVRWNSVVTVPFDGSTAIIQLEVWKITQQRLLSPLVEDSVHDDDDDTFNEANPSHEELLGVCKINVAPYIALGQALPNVNTMPQWYTLLSSTSTPFSCGRVLLSLHFDVLSTVPPPSGSQIVRKMKVSKELSYSDRARRNVTFQVGNTVFDVPERYQMIKAVGQGAYGCVIAASDITTGHSVAVKNVPNAFSDLIDAKRILREIRLMRHLHHPKLINMVDLFRPPSLHDFNDVYIVTDLMETDLHRVINSNQTLTDDHIQYFLYQMLVAIKYVHSASVLHRDLKPSNILVNANCDVKLCDFGLARGIDGVDGAALTDYVVTRWYRAPEVLLTCSYDKPMDVWAIGCILAELIGRRPLFPGTDFLHQLKIIMEVVGTPEESTLDFVTHAKAKRFISKQPKRRPIPFGTLYPRASPLAINLLERMLVFDPRERITVDEALAHPYLSSVRDPALEVECDNGIFDYSFEDVELTKENLQTLMFEDICHFHPDALWVKQPSSKGSRTMKSTPR